MSYHHVHDVLTMINETRLPYTKFGLQEAIIEHFGTTARFASCSHDNMAAEQAVEFLIMRGKFVPEQSGSCCGACGG